MSEKVAPARRSRRAASLTAQVLWNIQFQDENTMTLRSNTKVAKKELNSQSTINKEGSRKSSTLPKSTSPKSASSKAPAPKSTVPEEAPEKLAKLAPTSASKSTSPKSALPKASVTKSTVSRVASRKLTESTSTKTSKSAPPKSRAARLKPPKSAVAKLTSSTKPIAQKVVVPKLIAPKPTVTKLFLHKIPVISQAKQVPIFTTPIIKREAATTRKRKAVLPTKLAALACDDQTFDKKRKVETLTCSSYSFPERLERKPLQFDKNLKTKKLTASVAPFKATPLPVVSSKSTTTTHSASVPQQANPILLLPVSLQGNNDFEGVQNRGVGGLSLVTLQAPPNFLNCLQFNKTVSSVAGSSGQWASGVSNMMGPRTMPFQLNVKNPGFVNQSVPHQQMNQNRNSVSGDQSAVQSEPLNLKVGQSTVSNASRVVVTKSTIAQSNVLKPVTVAYPRAAMPQPKVHVQRKKQESTGGAKAQQITTRLLLRNLAQARPKDKKLKALSVRLGATLPSLAATSSTRKQQTKCPSPDYDCSSPDVDDVNRNPRHSCNRRHIKLRNKAAPPPGSLEYHEFVEEQRRLLLDIQRAQRVKAKAKKKLETKKSKLKRGNSDGDDRPLTAPATEIFKPHTSESSNHEWEWWGRQYTSLVYCAENKKYMSRTCYPAIRRKDGETESLDIVLVRDCVFLLANEDDELSYVAKVAALWEHPKTKEMMMSVVWYYRPDQTKDYQGFGVTEDEVYASKHQDALSVACIEQRCKILTYIRFCRLQAKLRKDRMWRKSDLRRVVPILRTPPYRLRPPFPNEDRLDPNDMFYCRHFYDVHSNRVKHKLRLPGSLSHEHSRRGAGVTSLASTT